MMIAMMHVKNVTFNLSDSSKLSVPLISSQVAADLSQTGFRKPCCSSFHSDTQFNSLS